MFWKGSHTSPVEDFFTETEGLIDVRPENGCNQGDKVRSRESQLQGAQLVQDATWSEFDFAVELEI